MVKAKAKAEQAESIGDRIPGWVKHDERVMNVNNPNANMNPNVRTGLLAGQGQGMGMGIGMRVGPGMVVNLKGARPAGAPPI